MRDRTDNAGHAGGDHPGRKRGPGLLRVLRDRAHALRRRVGLPSLGQIRRTPEEIQALRAELARVAAERTVRAELPPPEDPLAATVRAQADTIRWLSARGALSDSDSVPKDGPQVLVVLPVYQVGPLLQRAVASVRCQSRTRWRLLLLCRESPDVVRGLLGISPEDPQFVVPGPGVDSAAAGNLAAVQEALSDSGLIAWIEEHNEWQPDYLSQVVAHFARSPGAEYGLAAQLVEDPDTNAVFVRGRLAETPAAEASSADLPGLSVLSHRASLAAALDPGDPATAMQTAWRLLADAIDHPEAAIPHVGSRLSCTVETQVSVGGFDALHRYRVQRRRQKAVVNPPKVLYVVWDFPQLTETYVRWEIDCMRRWGVEVEVWSDLAQPESPFPSPVTVHHGPLEDVIRAVRPQIVHFHWIDFAARHLDTVARAGVPATVRGHGFEFNTGHASELLSHAGIQGLYLFPHYEAQVAERPRMEAMNAAFNGDLYYPEFRKDRRLVVRAGSAKPTKGVRTFIDTARLCPSHRFVLILGRLPRLGHYVDEIQEYNRQAGSPVEIHVNLPTEEVAAIVRRAGTYLHTYGDEEPFGMPISIAEAMATGCYILARNRPGAAAYVGPAGHLYETAEQAAQLIHLAEFWYPGQWKEQERRSIEYAHAHYGDVDVLRPILDCWQRVLATGADPALAVEDAFADETQSAIAFLMDESPDMLRWAIYGHPYLLHLLGTYRRLCEWNAPPPVCLTGLLHSIFLPWGERRARLEPSARRRQRLAEQVHPETERILYVFSALSRHDVFQTVASGAAPAALTDRLTGAPLPLDESTFREVCRVHLAEWLEKWKRLPDRIESIPDYGRIAAFLGGAALEDFRRTCLTTVAESSLPAAAAQRSAA